MKEYTMLKSFGILLTVILSLSYHIECADNELALAPSHFGVFARDWRVKGPNTILKWQRKFNPHEQFFYLTYDSSNDYCEITQVSTDSAEGESLTCQYKFKSDKKDIQIYSMIVPNKADKNDWIEFSYSSATSRAKNSWFIAPINFTKCRDENLHKSEGNTAAAAPSPADEDDKDVRTMEGPVPLSNKIKSSNLTSVAKGKKSECQLNDDLTELTCTQYDSDGKKVIDGVKYELPSWKPDWFRIHNYKGDAILLVFSDCVDGNCGDFSLVKLGPKGEESGRYVLHGLNLECHDPESDLTVDIADIPESKQVCVHMVCGDGHYQKNSEKRIESVLQYRRLCIEGDPIVD